MSSFAEMAQIAGNLSELLGAIAVFVTLAHLAVQVRQSNIATRAQINQARSDSFQQLQIAMMTSPSLVELAEKMAGEASWDASKIDLLSRVEKCQPIQLLILHRDRCDNQFYQFQLGYLDREFYESQVLYNIRIFGPLWTKLLRRLGRGSFMDEVDRVLATPDPGSLQEEVR
jgi:hypothetical protein